MAADIKKYTDYLIGLGTKEVSHSDKSFLAHLISVYRDLEQWECSEPICLAGLFHSIYGTERFQRFALSLERRDEMRDLIGEYAERLAYWNCVMDRPTFDATFEHAGELVFRDRITGTTIDPDEQSYRDLCTVHLCDWLEQVERLGDWDYRRAAYRSMAELLGGVALENYDRVFIDSSSIQSSQ